MGQNAEGPRRSRESRIGKNDRRWTPGKRSGSLRGPCTATRASCSDAPIRTPSGRPSESSAPSQKFSARRARPSASLPSRTSTTPRTRSTPRRSEGRRSRSPTGSARTSTSLRGAPLWSRRRRRERDEVEGGQPEKKKCKAKEWMRVRQPGPAPLEEVSSLRASRRNLLFFLFYRCFQAKKKKKKKKKKS